MYNDNDENEIYNTNNSNNNMHVIGNKLRRVSRECDAQIHEYKIIINGASEAYIRTLTNSYSYQGLTFKPTKRIPDEN